MLGGCLHVPALPKTPNGELIEIQTDAGFCNGHCDEFDIRVSSNGRGIVRVHHNAEITWFKAFRLTSAQFRSFHERLAPYRPVGDRFYIQPEACDRFATDLGGYHVTWSGAGPAGRLNVNDGCIGKDADAARAAVRAAVAMLGLKQLPDPSGGVVASTVMKAGVEQR